MTGKNNLGSGAILWVCRVMFHNYTSPGSRVVLVRYQQKDEKTGRLRSGPPGRKNEVETRSATEVALKRVDHIPPISPALEPVRVSVGGFLKHDDMRRVSTA